MIDSVELVIKQPGRPDRVVRLQDGATRLGRAEDNEVVLSDVGVSRRHAQVYVSRSEVTVEDLGSGNGTYYNGYRVQSQPVNDGDEIVIDPFVLHFRIRGPERAAPQSAQHAPPPEAGARLEVVVGAGMAGSVYPITARGLSIGRSEDRDLVIPDPAASRHHCQITPEGGEYTLRDMGSANGVFVNAVRVRECQLADGDMVRIGNTEMRFIGVGSPGAARGRPPQLGREAGRGSSGAPRPGRGATGSAAPTRRFDQPEGGSRRLLAVAVAGMVAFAGIVGVAVVAVVLAYFLIQPGGGGPREFAPHPPRWKLELPPNLPSARVDTLFNEGHESMKARNHRDALQDFYRILNAEPGRLGVGKFAYAAGEAMVLEALAKDFERLVEERKALEAERARLLARATGTRYRYSTRQRAQLALRRKFAADPEVLAVAEEQEWFEPSEEFVAIRQTAADANALMADGKFAEAAPKLVEVLEGGPAIDDEMRNQALSHLRLAHQTLAKKTTDIWSEAVILEASGQRGEAKSRFKQSVESYPTLPSARAHLERY